MKQPKTNQTVVMMKSQFHTCKMKRNTDPNQWIIFWNPSMTISLNKEMTSHNWNSRNILLQISDQTMFKKQSSGCRLNFTGQKSSVMGFLASAQLNWQPFMQYQDLGDRLCKQTHCASPFVMRWAPTGRNVINCFGPRFNHLGSSPCLFSVCLSQLLSQLQHHLYMN